MAELEFRNVSKTYSDGLGAVRDFSLSIPDGELFVLVGPSGCGKTSLLRMAAGLESLSSGEILIGKVPVNDLEPKDRDIAMVFQNYALYPHLSVFENIAFGLRAKKMPMEKILPAVRDVAEILGLSQVLQKRPGHLSGGQRQRVAMGRAMVRQPQVYLLDEPLSNLDALLRVQMRAEIARLQRELRVTTLYVTHDQTEAMTIGDRLAVLKDGELVQAGSPQAVYDEPASAFVGRFIGLPPMNLGMAGVRERSGELFLEIADTLTAIHPGQLARQPALAKYVGEDVLVGIRPEHVHIGTANGGADQSIRATVNLIERLGSEALIHVTLPLAEIASDENLPHFGLVSRKGAGRIPHRSSASNVDFIVKFDAQVSVRQGEVIDIFFDMTKLHAFDARSGKRI